MSTFYDEDEEELRLLEQYENEDLNQEDDAGHASDAIDSDLEDKILSMIQYESGLTKKKPGSQSRTATPITSTAQSPAPSPKVVYAPINTKESTKSSGLSAAHFLPLDNDSEDDLYVIDKSSDDDGEDDDDKDDSGHQEEGSNPSSELAATASDTNIIEPQITRFINLDDDDGYSLDESSDEEQSNLKLQELIKHRVNTNKSKSRLTEAPPMLCYNCYQLGHVRFQCTSCKECGGPKHPSYRCDALMYCLRCKKRGHGASGCLDAPTRRNCSFCNSQEHITAYCPIKLQSYVGEKPVKFQPTKYCYYCSQRGHYGDDCPDLPHYLISLHSVFSQYSLGDRHRNSREASPSPQQNRDFSEKARREKWPHFFTKNNDKSENNRYNGRHNSPIRNNNNNNNDDIFSRLGHNNKRRRYTDDVSSTSSNESRNRKGKGNKDRGRRAPTGGNSNSGNSNWKAINNNNNNAGSSSLPQPTRSGTVNVITNYQPSQQYETNFPRSNIPKPSSSGVIDLVGDESSGGGAYSKRKPRYHGGYNRKR
ncbi:MAG: hypothetical protein EXX96DRAFT_98100 [Benjaminiella poitrasii]|nr:MAG: hypothetical protein EXX96DRAFT_98100 [Benjaminiella poitrasii]